MTERTPSTWDEWVHFCFTEGDVDADHLYIGSTDTDIAIYLTRLFENPAFIADRYTDEQIARGTWYIFGTATWYMHGVIHGDVPPDLQIRCVRGITKMYTDLYDKVCGKRGRSPGGAKLRTKVDGAVYMMWDMDCLAGIHSIPHLIEPGIEIMESVLRQCRTTACRMSALHAIGHYVQEHHKPAPRIAGRFRALIDEFAQRPDVPDHLRKYAMEAREGQVQ